MWCTSSLRRAPAAGGVVGKSIDAVTSLSTGAVKVCVCV